MKRFALNFFISLLLSLFVAVSAFATFSQEDAHRILTGQSTGRIHHSFSSDELEKLKSQLETWHTRLERESVSLKIGDATYEIQPHAIGEGSRSRVYRLQPGGLVVKLPKPDWISIFRLIEEGERIQSLEAQAKQMNIETAVTKLFLPRSAVLIKNEISGRRLTEFLLDIGALVRIRSQEEASFLPRPEGPWRTKFSWLVFEIEKVIKARQQARRLLGDLGTNNFIVSHNQLVYVDLGVSFDGTLARYDRVENIQSFLEEAARDSGKYFQNGYLHHTGESTTPLLLCRRVYRPAI